MFEIVAGTQKSHNLTALPECRLLNCETEKQLGTAGTDVWEFARKDFVWIEWQQYVR